jgi:NitT/TauT family transport system ATP-binding protein
LAPILELIDVAYRYPGAEKRVIDSLSLAIAPREFVAVVGGSGVGKSTILRIAAGLIKPHSGRVIIKVARQAGRRRRALVFQDGRLMPWRTVWNNVGLGLEGLEIDAAEARSRIEGVLETTELTGLADRWPHQLSGGQLQRVGIARALAVRPDILLMDEPFSSVDAITRHRLQAELVRIWQTTATAVMFVTHDIEEAVYLADRVIVLGGEPARIVMEESVPVPREERGDPRSLYRFAVEVASMLENGKCSS